MNHTTFTSPTCVGDFSLYSCFQSTVHVHCTYIKNWGWGYAEKIQLGWYHCCYESVLYQTWLWYRTQIQITFFKKSLLQSRPLGSLCICHIGRNYKVPTQSFLMTRTAVVEDHFFLKFSLIWKDVCKDLNIYYPFKVSEPLFKGILTIPGLYSSMSEAVVFIFHEHLLGSSQW